MTELAAVARRFTLGRYTGVLAGLAIFCIYLSMTQSVFLTWSNWSNIFRSNGVIFILALGMTFVVITGGIDLSIASLTALAGMILGLSFQQGWSWPTAVLAAIGMGLFLGLVNGLLIGVARISFFVVTLGTLSIYQSVALLTTGGNTITLYSDRAFDPIVNLVNGSLGNIPYLLILYGALYVGGWYILHNTGYGRAIYAVGSNREAARLTGINVTAILVSVYAISGITGAMAGVVEAGRLAAAAPQVDPTLMLTVIAAVLIGGTNYTGGEGGLVGTVLGVLFLGVVQNGLALTGVSSFWQGTVSGVILIAAIGIGVVRDRQWHLRMVDRLRRPKQDAQATRAPVSVSTNDRPSGNN